MLTMNSNFLISNLKFIQLAYQLAGCAAGAAWAFIVSLFLLKVIDFIPICKARVDEKEES